MMTSGMSAKYRFRFRADEHRAYVSLGALRHQQRGIEQ
jgi:hypothetical protein